MFPHVPPCVRQEVVDGGGSARIHRFADTIYQDGWQKSPQRNHRTGSDADVVISGQDAVLRQALESSAQPSQGAPSAIEVSVAVADVLAAGWKLPDVEPMSDEPVPLAVSEASGVSCLGAASAGGYASPRTSDPTKPTPGTATGK